MKILIRKSFLLSLSLLISLYSLPLAGDDLDLDGLDSISPLSSTMNQMSNAFKALTKDLKAPVDANKDKYVKLATSIKENSVKAGDMTPSMAMAVPDNKKDDLIKSYKKDMDRFGIDMDTLIEALKAGKWDDANKDLAAVKKDMDDGHTKYRFLDQ